MKNMTTKLTWEKWCNLWYLKKEEKVLASVNWDVFKQQYYAVQGMKGKPQYAFEKFGFDDADKVKEIVEKLVRKQILKED